VLKKSGGSTTVTNQGQYSFNILGLIKIELAKGDEGLIFGK